MNLSTFLSLLKVNHTGCKRKYDTSKWSQNHKIILILPFFLFFLISAEAEIKTVIGNSGQGWTVASNWAPSGVPQSGDVIIIPAAFTISVKGTLYSTPFPSLIIKIFGTLDFDPSGKIDLSPSSIINIYNGGQIISNGTSSELINLGGVSKFNGQLDGTVNGPSYASAGTGTSPNGFGLGVLSIKIAAFNYQMINSSVKLYWSASHDQPSDKFQVQRNSGNGWITIAELPAAPGLNILNNYSFLDPAPARSINLYRIRSLNTDARENFSKTISVSLLPGIESLSVFPNPARTFTSITWKNIPGAGPVKFQLYNATMNRLISEEIPAGETSIYLDLGKYPTGMYTILIFNQTDLKQSVKLLVNN